MLLLDIMSRNMNIWFVIWMAACRFKTPHTRSALICLYLHKNWEIRCKLTRKTNAFALKGTRHWALFKINIMRPHLLGGHGKMEPPEWQLLVEHHDRTGDAVVMVTLNLHILATRQTGINPRTRKSKCSVTLMHRWHVITFGTAPTFHLFFTILRSPLLNKLIKIRRLVLFRAAARLIVSHRTWSAKHHNAVATLLCRS